MIKGKFMALKWIEGFETFTTADTLVYKYPSAVVTTSDTLFAQGRDPYGVCLNFGGTSIITPTLSNGTTYFIGFAFQNANLTATGFGTILEFRDQTTAQVSLQYNPSTGKFRVTSTAGGGSGWPVDQTSTTVYNAGFWYFVEMKVIVNGTTGAVVLKINGNEEINVTNKNTQVTGNTYSNTFAFVRTGFTGRYGLDDIYILDSVSSVNPPNNDFLGDVRVEKLVASAAGNSLNAATAWNSSSSAVANYAAVKYLNDNHYIHTNGANYVDTFNFGKLRGISTSIYGVAANVYTRNQDATSHTIAAAYRSTDGSPSEVYSTTVAGSTNTVSNTTTTCKLFLYEKDPVHNSGTQAWTATNLNSNSEFGVKFLT